MIQSPRGKGIAVKRGMLEARGEFRFMCDADLSMSVGEISRFLPPALQNYDIAIGSREAPGARRFNEPAYRHLQGRVFSNGKLKKLRLQRLRNPQQSLRRRRQ